MPIELPKISTTPDCGYEPLITNFNIVELETPDDRIYTDFIELNQYTLEAYVK